MPTSRPEPIPYIVNKIITLKPRTVLDVGIGFGKWGFLAREYTDIWLNHLNDAEGFKKPNWKSRVDGIEIYSDYITQLQNEIYTNIYIGNASNILPTLDITYDLIIASDILEHMNGKEGNDLISNIKLKSKHAFIVTPMNVLAQGAVYNNIKESHIYGWMKGELELHGPVTTAGGAYILETYNDPR